MIVCVGAAAPAWDVVARAVRRRPRDLRRREAERRHVRRRGRHEAVPDLRRERAAEDGADALDVVRARSRPSGTRPRRRPRAAGRSRRTTRPGSSPRCRSCRPRAARSTPPCRCRAGRRPRARTSPGRRRCSGWPASPRRVQPAEDAAVRRAHELERLRGVVDAVRRERRVRVRHLERVHRLRPERDRADRLQLRRDAHACARPGRRSPARPSRRAARRSCSPSSRSRRAGSCSRRSRPRSCARPTGPAVRRSCGSGMMSDGGPEKLE